MQERYCSCGGKVLVEYGHGTRRNVVVRYWSFCRAGGVTVRVCPHCGRPLDIHGLR
ncbi:MAG: hypothetical protein AB7D57_06905 [Desulfovibrionaceae bacterium]